jgi:hypothetical protein
VLTQARHRKSGQALIARKMVLQVAVRDIGQLTDI